MPPQGRRPGRRRPQGRCAEGGRRVALGGRDRRDQEAPRRRAAPGAQATRLPGERREPGLDGEADQGGRPRARRSSSAARVARKIVESDPDAVLAKLKSGRRGRAEAPPPPGPTRGRGSTAASARGCSARPAAWRPRCRSTGRASTSRSCWASSPASETLRGCCERQAARVARWQGEESGLGGGFPQGGGGMGVHHRRRQGEHRERGWRDLKIAVAQRRPTASR